MIEANIKVEQPPQGYEVVTANKLKPGDKVIDENDGELTITKVGNGIFTGSKIITYSNGKWSCIHNQSDVLRKPKT